MIWQEEEEEDGKGERGGEERTRKRGASSEIHRECAAHKREREREREREKEREERGMLMRPSLSPMEECWHGVTVHSS